uniref:Uncharacterized protein n=1 Tax=Anguilla anguilla TaxID=7936 RepID=A0A0E9XTE3_ANGAN
MGTYTLSIHTHRHAHTIIKFIIQETTRNESLCAYFFMKLCFYEQDALIED